MYACMLVRLLAGLPSSRWFGSLVGWMDVWLDGWLVGWLNCSWCLCASAFECLLVV